MAVFNCGTGNELHTTARSAFFNYVYVCMVIIEKPASNAATRFTGCDHQSAARHNGRDKGLALLEKVRTKKQR